MLLVGEWWLGFLPSPSQQTTQAALDGSFQGSGMPASRSAGSPWAAGCKVRLCYRRSGDLLRVTVGSLFCLMLDWHQTKNLLQIFFSFFFFSSSSAGVCGGLHRTHQSKQWLHPENRTFKSHGKKKGVAKLSLAVHNGVECLFLLNIQCRHFWFLVNCVSVNRVHVVNTWSCR